MNHRLAAVEGETTELKRENMETRERVSSLEGEITGLKRENMETKERVSSLEGKTTGLKRENMETKERVSSLEGENERLTASVSSSQGRNQHIDIRVLLDTIRLDMIRPCREWTKFLSDTCSRNTPEAIAAISANMETHGITRWNELWKGKEFKDLLLSNKAGTLRADGNHAVHMDMLAETMEALPDTDSRKSLLLASLEVLRELELAVGGQSHLLTVGRGH